MDYLEVEEAIEKPGLRLVLTAGVPGPWGEAAKAILAVKKIPYLPVRQKPGVQDERLLAWTQQTGAPAAMYGNERPRSGWAEILFLAERLQPEPALLPRDAGARALALGLCHEICGEHGLGWTRRLMFMAEARPEPNSMPWKYGCDDPAAIARAPERVVEIVAALADQLRRQQQAGRRFLVGETLSAVDLYWAAFSNMLHPLPPEQGPMPDYIRGIYGSWKSSLPKPSDPGLLAHRDLVFERFVGLPLDY